MHDHANPTPQLYSKLQNLNRSLEKKLFFTKNAFSFSHAATGPGWLVTNKGIKVQSYNLSTEKH